MMTIPQMPPRDNLVISYLQLRKLVGAIGLMLPLFLVGLGYLLEGRLRPTLSDYYYSPLRDLFVGTMFAIGTFLIAYRGYDRTDNVLANLAGLSAIALALVPTTEQFCQPAEDYRLGPVIHLAAATSFLVLVAAISLFRFTLSAPQPTAMKKVRNAIYIVMGLTILAMLALLAWRFLVTGACLPNGEPQKDVLLFESLAVIAFGLSWIVKGEALFPDRATQP